MYGPFGYSNMYGFQTPQFGQFMPGSINNGSSPYQSPAQQSIQPQQASAPVVLQVSTIKQVEQAPVQPGGKALVLVANEPVIAMRTADNMGITSTDYYHIERFDPESQAMPTNDYVTRQEFQQTIQKIVNSISDPSKQIDVKQGNNKEAAK